MIETYYKSLNLEQTYNESLSNIIEAFVAFYGEEDREEITSRFQNMVFIGVNNPENMQKTIELIKQEKTAQLLSKLSEVIMAKYPNVDVEDIKKYITNNGILMDNVLNYLIDSSKNDKTDMLFSTNMIFLSMIFEINPGLFDDFSIVYSELVKLWHEEEKKLEPYIEYLKRDEERKQQLLAQYNENFRASLKGLVPNWPNEIYLGCSLSSISLIDAFSSEADDKIERFGSIFKDSIIKDRIQFFNALGINLGEEYSIYANDERCRSLIPSNQLIEQIRELKKNFYDKMMTDYYTSTEEYNNNIQKLLSVFPFADSMSYGCSEAPCIIPWMVNYENGTPFSMPVLFLPGTQKFETLDVSLIHELNHIRELHLLEVKDEQVTCLSGWDVSQHVSDESEKKESDKSEERINREYELFNEAINEKIAQEITIIMYENGNHIFNNENNIQISNSTAYDHLFFLIDDFYTEYKREILQSRKTGNMKIIFEKVGKDNFERLNELIKEFRRIFPNGIFLSVLEDNIKNGINSEIVKIYYEICNKRDEILESMKQYSLDNLYSQNEVENAITQIDDEQHRNGRSI